MKTLISCAFVSIALLFLPDFFPPNVAQEDVLSSVPSRKVTLLSAIKHAPDDGKALFNFDIGVRGDDQVKPKRNRYDIRYGGISENGDDRWLDLADHRGSRSVMRDLGIMKWSEILTVPILFASTNPHTGEVATSYQNGMVVKIEPEGVIAKAEAGHIYVMHVKDDEVDYYVLFRVERVNLEGECEISWRKVKSPEG